MRNRPLAGDDQGSPEMPLDRTAPLSGVMSDFALLFRAWRLCPISKVFRKSNCRRASTGMGLSIASSRLSEEKETKKSSQYAHECVRADPQGIYSLSTLASVQLDLKKLSEAARTAETIRSLAPDSFEAHEMMGYVALNGSKIKEALIHFERALKISPESADTLSIYAWTLYVKAQRLGAGRKKRELLKNAIKVFELSLQTNPTSISTKANLKKAIDLYLLTDNVSILTMISILLITIPVLLIHKLNLETPAAINILEKPPDLFIIIILMLIEIHILGFVTGGNRAIRTLPPKSRFFIESQSQSIHKLPFLILYALFLLVPIGVFIWRLSNYGIGSVSELTVFDWISLLTASAVFGYYAKFLRGELRKSKLWNRLKLTAEKE
jgi:tetratricopeptide (TPR) repeat protein